MEVLFVVSIFHIYSHLYNLFNWFIFIVIFCPHTIHLFSPDSIFQTIPCFTWFVRFIYFLQFVSFQMIHLLSHDSFSTWFHFLSRFKHDSLIFQMHVIFANDSFRLICYVFPHDLFIFISVSKMHSFSLFFFHRGFASMTWPHKLKLYSDVLYLKLADFILILTGNAGVSLNWRKRVKPLFPEDITESLAPCSLRLICTGHFIECKTWYNRFRHSPPFSPLKNV